MINRFLPSIVLVFLAVSVAFSQSVPQNSGSSGSAGSKRESFYPLEDLEAGMTGKARTVFVGTTPEEFDVEILGVLPGWVGPKQDMIVCRISGGKADKTRVFAGMSGSPVFVEGRLVGAIAYSFPFAEEAICGITPIEQMVSQFEKNEDVSSSPVKPRSYSFAELAATSLPLRDRSVTAPAASGKASMSAFSSVTFQPIAIPVSFSGFSQSTLNEFAPALMKAGLLPVSAPVGAPTMGPMKEADETTLRGGDSVIVHLTRGDFSMAAAGTVTMRDGNKIYGFGHPFLGLGSSDLPMSESHVVTVVPNINNSFKLAVPDAMVGSMTQDRATGVLGELGTAPKMIPVRLNLTTSRNQRESLEFEIAKDEFLTPLLLNMAVFNAITANERGLGDLTVELKSRILSESHRDVRVERKFVGKAASGMAAGAVAVQASNLLTSRFEELDLSGVEIEIRTLDGGSTAKLFRLESNRAEARPGDSISLQAFVRRDSGEVLSHTIPFTVPAGTPAGTLTIEIADGDTLMQKEASKQFVPGDLNDLIDRMNKLKRNDRLYVQAYRVTKGAIVGASEMPNLPPSVLATMNSNRASGGFTPTLETVVTEFELDPAEFIITGRQSLKIEVLR